MLMCAQAPPLFCLSAEGTSQRGLSEEETGIDTECAAGMGGHQSERETPKRPTAQTADESEERWSTERGFHQADAVTSKESVT
ncbi:chloroplastic,Probable homogentisate phytyltransferase 1 [Trichinella spiralis]|uniref:Chloroplastic,Probable homogentisate phytyltransferase 1 n=1 Tax=Trichinella spiralis TaxID=6334 RepID=A0ABR3KZC2_TRISP